MNFSDKVEGMYQDIEKVKDSKLFKRLNTLQNEIEDIKEFLISEKYKSVSDKVVEEATENYKKHLSDIIYNFVDDLDLDNIEFQEQRNLGPKIIEDQRVVSDKFSVEIKSEFIESDFIKEWDEGDVFNDGYTFRLNYQPSGETLTLFLNKVKDDILKFTIDEEELSKLEFIRTLFKRSEYREIQVMRKSDLKMELVEYTDDIMNVQPIEFENITFK